MRRNSAATAILIGGLIAGLCDIAYAVGISGLRGVPAMRVLQSVASGLLGAPAYEGGAPVAALGLLLHFLMALLIAAIFYFACRRLVFLMRHPVTLGAIYGVIVYLVMNFVVIPLSAFPGKPRFVPIVVITSLIVHAFFVGVPIALATRRAAAPAAT